VFRDSLWHENGVATVTPVSSAGVLRKEFDDSRRRRRKRCGCVPVVGSLLEQLDNRGEVGGWKLDLDFLVNQRTPIVSIHRLSSPVLDISLSEIVSDHVLPSFTDTTVEGPLQFGVDGCTVRCSSWSFDIRSPRLTPMIVHRQRW
jgi:hypothetical protein